MRARAIKGRALSAFTNGTSLREERSASADHSSRDRESALVSDRLNVGLLLALRSLLDLKAHLLPLLKGLEALRLHFRKMSKQVFAAIVWRNEAKALRIVKPLHSTGCHDCFQN